MRRELSKSVQGFDSGEDIEFKRPNRQRKALICFKLIAIYLYASQRIQREIFPQNKSQQRHSERN